MIALIDYGSGNLRSVHKALLKVGAQVRLARRPEEMAEAEAVVLPGVGAFDHAIELLNQSGMRDTLDEIVLQERVPVLGICVGMQIMARSSEEGRLPGLGWINGHVKKFVFAQIRIGSVSNSSQQN